MREVRKAFPVTNSNPMLISLTGITYPDPTYHIVRKNSNVAVIEYVLAGQGYINLNGQLLHLQKDMIYFLPAGLDHEYFAAEDDPFTKIFMNIADDGLLSRLISAYGLNGKYVFDGKGLKELFEKILITIHSDITDDEMQAVFHGIFTEVISRISGKERMSAHSEEALRLQKYLNSHTDRIVSGKELAQVIFRSPDYCLKLFRREFGVTPYAYQLECKIGMAKSLLRDTAMTVGEIAETLGYADLHYFSNLFKAKCGCRPLDYRKRSR